MTMIDPTPTELNLLVVANTLSDPLQTAGVEIVSKDNSGNITDDIVWSVYGLVVNGEEMTLTISKAGSEPTFPIDTGV